MFPKGHKDFPLFILIKWEVDCITGSKDVRLVNKEMKLPDEVVFILDKQFSM